MTTKAEATIERMKRRTMISAKSAFVLSFITATPMVSQPIGLNLYAVRV